MMNKVDVCDRKEKKPPFLCLFLGIASSVILLTPVSRSQGLLDDISRWEEGRSMSSSSVRLNKDGLPDPTANVDCNRIVEPDQTVIIADLKGPGVITHIWMTVYHFQSLQFGAEPGGRANPQEILIRMYWDGREKPDVEVPMSDFFAAGFGKRTTVLSLPVVTEDGDSYNCWWRMPFRKSARIEVINQSKKNLRALFHSVDWIKKKTIPENAMYFCAQYRQEYPVQGDPDKPDNEYLILDASGKGYYVGTVLSVRTRSPDWFGEGDIRMAIDGEQKPSIWGTGTEDYFLSAWGQKPCLTPYFGTAYLSHKNRDVGQMSSCYRWHIADPIVFNTSLRVTIETMGFANRDENPEGRSRLYWQRQDDVSSVAYWYQFGPSKKFAETTTPEQRKLPSIDPIIAWGKDYQADQYHGKGLTRMRNTDTYFDTDPVLEFTPDSKDDAWIELSFQVNRKQPFRLVVVLGRSPQSGIYQASLEGVKIGKPIDLYNDTSDVDDYQLMDFWPEPGRYTLRLECIGHNHLSSGGQIRINSVRLRERRPRVERFGYLKDHDWRANPILIDKTTPPLKAGQR
ncbi:MAG: DUF2961 domain-containing protein [Sedimentisphaerales bacterium]|nr:DUF2961 domain-containing protein [Sedimentisphaerales bacterium]